VNQSPARRRAVHIPWRLTRAMYSLFTQTLERGSDGLSRVTSEAARLSVSTNRPEVLAQILQSLERGGLRAAVLMGKPGAESTLIPTTCELVLIDLDSQPGAPEEVVASLKSRSDAKIVALSDRQDEDSKVRVLDAGASDYIVIPFGPSELLARVQARLRDSSPRRTPLHTEFIVDADRRVVRIAGREVQLTPLEFQLFSILVQKPGQIMAHGRLLTEVWGEAAERRLYYLRVYMNKLRAKLEPDPANPVFLLSIPKLGYMFRPEVR